MYIHYIYWGDIIYISYRKKSIDEGIIKPPNQPTETYIPHSDPEMLSLVETFINHVFCFRHNER